MARSSDTHFNPLSASADAADVGIAQACEQRSMLPRVRTNASTTGITEVALVARYVR